jgi:hypothetical protein
MGANEWWGTSDWPIPGTQQVPFYFHAVEPANGVHGKGALSTEVPDSEPPDRYLCDPLNPVGSDWSMHAGPIDETEATDRPDVLCYTSEPLTAPLEVVGPIMCILHAASSARDADWHVRVADVRPDGYAQFLCSGVLRARFRESLTTPKLLTPNRAEEFTIEVGATGVSFLPGHRIRVEVASSWFPQFDRNLNSGSDNNFLDDKSIVAEQTIFHDRTRPSRVVLPVIPAEQGGITRGVVW